MLTERLEREPTSLELAAALGVEPTELASYQNQAQVRQLISFDEMSDGSKSEESLPLTERLPDLHASNPDAAILSTEDRRIVLKCLGSLPKTQATVVVLHYFQGVPLRDVAKMLEVTPSRVSQLHQQALGKLKQTWRRTQSLA